MNIYIPRFIVDIALTAVAFTVLAVLFIFVLWVANKIAKTFWSTTFVAFMSIAILKAFTEVWPDGIGYITIINAAALLIAMAFSCEHFVKDYQERDG